MSTGLQKMQGSGFTVTFEVDDNILKQANQEILNHYCILYLLSIL